MTGEKSCNLVLGASRANLQSLTFPNGDSQDGTRGDVLVGGPLSAHVNIVNYTFYSGTAMFGGNVHALSIEDRSYWEAQTLVAAALRLKLY